MRRRESAATKAWAAALLVGAGVATVSLVVERGEPPGRETERTRTMPVPLPAPVRVVERPKSAPRAEGEGRRGHDDPAPPAHAGVTREMAEHLVRRSRRDDLARRRLVEVAFDPRVEHEIRLMTVRAALSFGPDDELDRLLLRAEWEPDHDLYLEALRGLGAHGSPRAVMLLQEVAARGRDHGAREVAAETLTTAGPPVAEE